MNDEDLTSLPSTVEENELKIVEKEILSIKVMRFEDLDLTDIFFDPLKNDYGEKEFEEWFSKKAKEKVYVSFDIEGKINGFLYLKIENSNEDYNNVKPIFRPKKRLKIGTFKITSKGLRVGERFLQIIFENARENEIDEIYLTIFEDNQNPAKKKFIEILNEWGFEKWGTKNEIESVFLKRIEPYNNKKSVKQNFPTLKPKYNIFFLPIKNQFHNDLIPDSPYKNEQIINMEEKANMYALEKVYISGGSPYLVKPGDLLLVYRMGAYGTNKKYTSTLTSICIVNQIIMPKNKDDFLSIVGNRSIFNKQNLEVIWSKLTYKTVIVKFIFYKTLNRKIILNNLYEFGIIEPNNGPRPFDEITKEQFEKILEKSETNLK